MKPTMVAMIVLLSLASQELKAQTVRFGEYEATAVGVVMSKVKMAGKDALMAVKDSAIKGFDEPTFIRIGGADFKNGTIEVKVLSQLLPNAPEMARGFIGVAFRINDSNTKFESIYVRPVNARVEDQVRRNHSIQYFSYPDYKFDTLRKIAPERYESYTDMEMNKWITLRIEVRDARAKLFIDRNEQPSLVVNDLKHGSNNSGAVALWVEVGTKGYFSELKIVKQQ